MSASLGLYRLQLVDSRMDQIRARLSEIQVILENNQQVQAASQKMDEKTSLHEEAARTLKQAEEAVKAQKLKIEQCEVKLYSGNVKNPKELEDLQNESVALKRYLITLEDRQLEAMLAEEEARETLNTAKQALEQAQAQAAEQNQTLSTEKAALDKELEKLNAERDAARIPLDPNLLTVYENLRQQRGGLAVAQVSDGACAACGTTLTPALQQSARSSTELHNCSTCGRILYAN
ncbi:MAG: hypothetical protein Kow002_05080 [Anaerolineales bacterium]